VVWKVYFTNFAAMYDVTVVGGGIVGLATAYQLISDHPGLKILILEKESAVAQHQTGHNSGVIHSGLYYKPGSLKALNCIEGYHRLLDFCQIHQIKHEICGKIVVATEAHQLHQLDVLAQRGTQNGLAGIKHLNAEELRDYEPHVSGLAGLWVPQTGIIDYMQVATKLQELLTEAGAVIKFNQKVTGIDTPSKVVISTREHRYESKLVVGCAGLYSDRVAAMTEERLDVRIVPFRGEYFKLKPEKEHLVKNLIYPVPDPSFPFLGVHFTRMMKGGVEAGPNAVLAFAREGYSKSQINLKELYQTLSWPGFQKVAYKYWRTGFGELYRSFSKSAFTKALQQLIPEVQQSDLEPGGAGVRAQASDSTGGLLDDFMIIENKSGVHVCNAPSPAATSSLAIGAKIAHKVLARV